MHLTENVQQEVLRLIKAQTTTCPAAAPADLVKMIYTLAKDARIFLNLVGTYFANIRASVTTEGLCAVHDGPLLLHEQLRV